MKLKAAVLATLLAIGGSSAFAGNFVNLTQGVGGIVSSDVFDDDFNLVSAGNGGLLNGANKPNQDIFYIENLDSTYLTGYGYGSSKGVIATELEYRAFVPSSRGNVDIAISTLKLIEYRISENVPLLPGIAQGKIFDFVYRDELDGKLVFGTRYMNMVDNQQEVNYLYRQGAGNNASVAWTFLTDNDLRMYQAGQTNDNTFDSAVDYTAGVVRQKADISVSEGNPWSGLYLVKTDAADYQWGANAIGFYQAGEEGQAVVGGYISGFVAKVTTPVPEPESYALMLAGLSLVGLVSRRRKFK